MNLQKLHVQSKLWKRHNRNAQGWTLYCVNDINDVESPRESSIHDHKWEEKLSFCNYWMQLIFSYMWHIQLLNPVIA
jgi:hypothetical protein